MLSSSRKPVPQTVSGIMMVHIGRLPPCSYYNRLDIAAHGNSAKAKDTWQMTHLIVDGIKCFQALIRINWLLKFENGADFGVLLFDQEQIPFYVPGFKRDG